MPAKPAFTEAQHELIRETAIKLWETKFRKMRRQGDKPGGQEAMALALGVSQQTVSNLLRGTYRPSVTVARAIANLDGKTLEQLIGDFGIDESVEAPAIVAGLHNFANLKTCIDFYSTERHWSAWTIAAARAGFFGNTDFAAPAWVTKLDMLEKALEKVRAGK